MNVKSGIDVELCAEVVGIIGDVVEWSDVVVGSWFFPGTVIVLVCSQLPATG
jgi:hypothetical protein